MATPYEFQIHVDTESVNRIPEEVEPVQVEQRVEQMEEDTAEGSEKKTDKEKLTEDEEYFLEFKHAKLFKDAQSYRPVSYLDTFESQSSRFRRDYLELLDKFGKFKKEVFSYSRIVKVKDVRMKKHKYIDFSEFDIVREDGSEVTISEADFKNLHLQDLKDIHSHLAPFEDKVFKFRKAIAGIRHGMLRVVKWAALIDFQTALELKKDSVCLTAPDTHLDNIRKYKTGTIVRRPESGLVIKTSENGEKLFFRVSEASKYCTATLKLIMRALEEKKTKGHNVEEMMKLIQSQLYFRDLIRKFLATLAEYGFDLSRI